MVHGTRQSRLVGWTVAVAAVAILGMVVFMGMGSGAPAAAANHEATPGAGHDVATVNVNGQGSVFLTPDTAQVTVGVDIMQPSLSDAQAEATQHMEAIIAAIETFGIADEDIQTVSYNVNVIYQYSDQGFPAGIQGFQVTNQVSVKVRDLDQVGALLDAAVAAGANSIYGINFTVDDGTGAASQARRQAMADARAKAEELADEAGMTLGRIVSITESFSPPVVPLPFGAGAAADMAERASVPIQPGSTEVQVQVQVVFELV